LQTENGKPLGGERITFLAENGYDYVGALDIPRRRTGSDPRAVTFLSLPLSQGFPANELKYIIENSQAEIFLSTTKIPR
jgi:malonyl-CoA/methylmalonyl-CoA synthetase